MPNRISGTVDRTYFTSPKFSAGVLLSDTGDRVRFRGPFCANEGDLVTLVGEGLQDPFLGPPSVTVSGVEAEGVSAGSYAVTILVPVGADSGPVVARVGPLRSPPVRREVSGYGVHARYYDLPAALDLQEDVVGGHPADEGSAPCTMVSTPSLIPTPS